MYDDPVVEEVHRIREALSASMDHDLEKIVAYFIERQGKDGRTVVSRPPKPPIRKPAQKPGGPLLPPPQVESPPTTSTSNEAPN